VDDILIVHNENHTDIHEVHTSLNNLAPTVTFTIKKETDNKINFLDIILAKEKTYHVTFSENPQLPT
jgi:hypothetical protein